MLTPKEVHFGFYKGGRLPELLNDSCRYIYHLIYLFIFLPFKALVVGNLFSKVVLTVQPPGIEENVHVTFLYE